LAWSEEPATYVLDGRVLGNGDTGFEALLSEMRRWPEGSTLVVIPWVDHVNGILVNSGSSAGPPYAVRKFELYRVIDEGRLRMEHPGDTLGGTHYLGQN
jgi:hypothetical protein